jgi:4-alpha-glucanotransferase
LSEAVCFTSAVEEIMTLALQSANAKLCGNERGKLDSLPPNSALDLNRRSSGVLLHLTSLPGPHGCGDLGLEAHRFVDFLVDAGQTWWQMLPIGPPGRAPGFSPYDSSSAFAGSPWLVSLQTLAQHGLLAPRDLKPTPPFSSRQVNFPATCRFREARQRQAFASFRRRRGERGRAFREFCDANADWLEDFALFMAARRDSGGKPWTEWEGTLSRREPSALRHARQRLAHEVAGHRFVQFEFHRQWQALRQHAHRRGIGLIGDLPIFVAHDSADVWSQPELFQLDRRGWPRRVSGYPPDRFNRTGQLWGHPQYEWAKHRRAGFAWWIRRFERIFERFDAVRIDHFLGFTRTWSVPTPAENARRGRWMKSPGSDLFAAVERKLGRRPMIAEDLGHVTPADVRLRNAFRLAPMRIFQFGFGQDGDAADHLPHHYAPLTVAYTGNHDNDTTVGWFNHLPPAQRQRALTYVGGRDTAFHLAAIRTLMACPANAVIFPMQDVLGLDERARMNVPGTAHGNWRWRLPALPLDRPAQELLQLTELFDRRRFKEGIPRAARKERRSPRKKRRSR